MGHPTAIFLAAPDPNYKCAICLDVFDNPVSLLQCGHTYCRSCLDSTLCQSGQNCHECRAAIDLEDDDDDFAVPGGNVIHSVRVIESAIGNSLVRCRNGCLDEHGELLTTATATNNASNDNSSQSCHGGCNWTGLLSSWPIHSSTTCPISIITCPIPGCSHTSPRNAMKSHIGSPSCVKAAVVSQVETATNGFLDDLKKQMKKEMERRVKEWKKEKNQLESQVQCEMDQRLVLQEVNHGMRREVRGLKQTVKSMQHQMQHAAAVQQQDCNRWMTAVGSSHAASSSSPSSGSEQVELKGKKKKKRNHSSAMSAVSISPTSSVDGASFASSMTSSSVMVNGEENKRKRKKKRKAKRQQRQLVNQEDAEERGSSRMRSVSTDSIEEATRNTGMLLPTSG